METEIFKKKNFFYYDCDFNHNCPKFSKENVFCGVREAFCNQERTELKSERHAGEEGAKELSRQREEPTFCDG